MIEIGAFNTLRAKRNTINGWYLACPDDEEVLLPNKYIPEGFKTNDLLEVFVYKDSEDRIVATTENPYAIVGEFSNLKVKDVSKIGAFLDWGLEKDLLVPFGEQKRKLEVGEHAIVYVYLDEQTGRIAASCKVDKFLESLDEEYKEGEEVDLLIYRKTDLGYEAIIDDHALGLIYTSEIHQKIKIGDRLDGYIANIREDGKIDLRLQKTGMDHLDEVSKVILNGLVAAGGFLPLHDKSSPSEIKQQFQISKKAFKKAIGILYKKRMIEIQDKGIKAV
ncbi:CvfB family protein [Parvicella tangerina]|uniref:Conserved virulence factor B n=1 Tax=Parvicella tangerina TaxID=2829795 RepID=A0A916JLY6_9FLAO|nr:S1-like domain-containing RNA-binding protein [Parvicella tangerina]CAG5081051.1 Conserved virulence factor B [Parvicella tangerina]